jgi:cell division transport system permease protein
MNSFSTALVNMRRSPYQSMAAILLLTVTFFVGYIFSLFAVGSEKILQYFETRPQVIAFFNLDTDAQTINEVATQLDNESYITDIKLVSKEEALNMYQEENKDDPLLLELVTSQILPASIEVSASSLDDLKKVKDILEQNDAVDEVVLQEDILESLARWTTNLRLVGIAIIIILATTSLLLMVIVIGMKVVTRRPAINIMRIIGATKWFIRSPFVFEGLLYGLLSSILGWSGALATLFYLTPDIKNFLGPIPLFPIDPAFFAVQLSVGTLVGMILGAMAGSLAVGRVMRK